MRKEKAHFRISDEWYKGKMPDFFEPANYSFSNILEDNYRTISEEFISAYNNNHNLVKSMSTAHGYMEENWKHLPLYTFMIEFPQNSKMFPKTHNIVKRIPDLISAQFFVLSPHTRVKAHFGDTDAVIRTHLGLKVTGNLPQLGIRVGKEARCWQEGKVLSFCDAKRHCVWNYTEHDRIVFLIDTIHPDFVADKQWISSGLLACAYMKTLSLKISILKKSPKQLNIVFHKIFSILFSMLLVLQTKLKLNLFHQFFRLKVLFKRQKLSMNNG